jgi:hypothetical protein
MMISRQLKNLEELEKKLSVQKRGLIIESADKIGWS